MADVYGNIKETNAHHANAYENVRRLATTSWREAKSCWQIMQAFEQARKRGSWRRWRNRFYNQKLGIMNTFQMTFLRILILERPMFNQNVYTGWVFNNRWDSLNCGALFKGSSRLIDIRCPHYLTAQLCRRFLSVEKDVINLCEYEYC